MLEQAIGLAQGSDQSADGLGSSQPGVSRPPPGTSGTTGQAVRVGYDYSPGALLPEYWREWRGHHFFLCMLSIVPTYLVLWPVFFEKKIS